MIDFPAPRKPHLGPRTAPHTPIGGGGAGPNCRTPAPTRTALEQVRETSKGRRPQSRPGSPLLACPFASLDACSPRAVAAGGARWGIAGRFSEGHGGFKSPAVRGLATAHTAMGRFCARAEKTQPQRRAPFAPTISRHFPPVLEVSLTEKKITKRGRPSREDALRRAIEGAGVDPASVDPRRILAAIAADAKAPAGARVQACRALIGSADKPPAPGDGGGVPDDALSRRALELIAGRRTN